MGWLQRYEAWAMTEPGDSFILGFFKWGIFIFGPIAVGLLIIVGLVAFPFIYADSKNPHIVLNKAEWNCTDTRTQTIMMPMATGKTVMMLPQTTTYCVQYTQK